MVALSAAVGLASFGTFVVRANDDAGALAFIRSQTKSRPIPAAPAYAPAARQAFPVSFYAPRSFFPQAQPTPRQPQRQSARPGAHQRPGAIVASYAPFIGFFPSDTGIAPRNPSLAIRTPSAAKPAAVPSVGSGIGVRGGRVTYCVRTCDGFFFPLSSATGNDAADLAACNRFCPTSETRLYIGQIGAEIDDARARQTGRRYAQMPNAFSYRQSVSGSCSCSASGFGLTNDASVMRDPTLRAGDIVMTRAGMRVFTGGGQFPYRESNFTSLDRAASVAGQTKDTLKRMERASMPGRGLPARTEARRQTDELADLRRAARTIEAPTNVVRYVGPDRSALAR